MFTEDPIRKAWFHKDIFIGVVHEYEFLISTSYLNQYPATRAMYEDEKDIEMKNGILLGMFSKVLISKAHKEYFFNLDPKERIDLAIKWRYESLLKSGLVEEPNIVY